MTTSTVNVNELTFGVEIETALPADTVRVGGYHSGLPVPSLPDGWRAERDGSIQCPPGNEAAEFVSPILQGAVGLRQVIHVLDWLRGVRPRPRVRRAGRLPVQPEPVPALLPTILRPLPCGRAHAGPGVVTTPRRDSGRIHAVGGDACGRLAGSGSRGGTG